MSEARFQLSLLKPEHDRTGFNCGVPELDRYFHQFIGQDRRRNVSAAFVLVDKDQQRIAGYYTISASSIELSDLPSSESKKLPHYPKLPACLIGRLAVDRNYQGVGLGRMLLFDALRRAWEINTQMSLLAVIVDAIDDRAEAFYQQFGFRSLGNPARRQLYLLIADAQKLFQRSD